MADETPHKGLPVSGYRAQSQAKVDLVNEFKATEERLLRRLDELGAEKNFEYERRWLAIARTNIEQGFMALNRAVFMPTRVALPEDGIQDMPDSVGTVAEQAKALLDR